MWFGTFSSLSLTMRARGLVRQVFKCLIAKVSVVIMDSVRWEQNVEMLVCIGENVLGCC